MSRNPRRAPHVTQRPAEGTPLGGWAAADLTLPALWYHVIALAGVAFPVSGDQQPDREGRS